MSRTRTWALLSALAASAMVVLWWGLHDAAGPSGAPDGRRSVLYDAPSFVLQDQTGDTLRSSELRGTPWVLHVFFTNCRTVCPATTARMAGLRDSLGAEVRLVSITVDPARDTLAAIRAWAERHGAADPSRWAFLRGEPPGRVRRLVEEGFHLSAMMPADATGDYQVSHSPRVLLVDERGRVRDSYLILRPEDYERLLGDARRLAD